MMAFLIVLQVLVALFLIMVVLLQPGNRGGVSAAMGGAGGETVFGARGANTLLAKLTFGAATLFMICNVALSFLSASRSSLMDKIPLSVQSTPISTPPASSPKEATSEGKAATPKPAPLPPQ